MPTPAPGVAFTSLAQPPTSFALRLLPFGCVRGGGVSSFCSRMAVAEETKATKDIRFDPSRIPVTVNAKTLVDIVRRQLLSYEAHRSPRKRARKQVDQVRFDRIVAAIVCDLAHAALTDPKAWRHISLSKRKHGREAVGAPFMTEARIEIIEWMNKPEMDWLELRKAAQVRNPFGGQQSTIRASARLRNYMADHEIHFGDLGRDPELMGDPIVLRSGKVNGKAKALSVPPGQPAETYRAEMLKINRWLTAADIVCDWPDKNGRLRDDGQRRLRRIFNNGRLDHGGRLYDGFWQPMPDSERLGGIAINDEPVVSLDFGQCAISIAYAQMKALPPEGDLYLIPGFEECREGVKKVLSAQLHRSVPMQKFPRGTRKYFPRRLKVDVVVEAILRHHAPIRPLLFTGFGMPGFFIESQILVRSLLELIDQGVVALPIHDCLLVPLSAAEAARDVMQASFKAVTGARTDIEIDGVCGTMPSGEPWPALETMPWITLFQGG